MDLGTRHFLGTHDFTSFCATATQIEDRVRTIYDALWTRDDEQWVFRVRGNGFLQYMVRTIVGTLLNVGQRKLDAGRIPEIFAIGDRRSAGPCVPANGLHLIEVEY